MSIAKQVGLHLLVGNRSPGLNISKAGFQLLFYIWEPLKTLGFV